ncbi:MAG: 50S ribosomal protein L15e [Nanoarchaeota archaeon]
MAKEQSKEIKKAPRASAHGMYYYLSQVWRHPSHQDVLDLRKKLIEWRAGNVITKLEHPTRLDRARILGYKAKKGFLVFRVILWRGGRHKKKPNANRRSKRMSTMKILRMNYRWVAEQRLQKEYRNLEVLNSYLVGRDGQHLFFEVIAVDRNAPEITKDPNFAWIKSKTNKFRALRGLTSAGRKSRGMSTKRRDLKVRPSLRAWGRRGR